MKPSNFTSKPFGSVLQNAESEIVARNIMVILSRTGNTFRNLTWEEYKKERLQDGDFSQNEYEHFQSVIDYCKSADTAKLFSKEWAKQFETQAASDADILENLTKEDLIKIVANMHDTIQEWDDGYGLSDADAKMLIKVGDACASYCVKKDDWELTETGGSKKSIPESVANPLATAVASIRSNFELWCGGKIKDGVFSFHLQNNLSQIEKDLFGWNFKKS